MNRWKLSFFALAGLIVAAVAYLIFLIGSPASSEPLPDAKVLDGSDYVLEVEATKEDFEGIANTYIKKAMKGEPLPVKMEVGKDVTLFSEMTVFSYTLPVIMHFDPIVREDGNLILKQSSMEVGQLNIPPSTVLKILRDSVKLPPWMIVRPKEEELFIDLSKIAISDDLQVRAKTFNLEENEIILEIIIPKE
ncbi:YpmS family protein [Sporosarcina sp. FSL K6-1522]|uniref:YpmS family protein n=1 Tax=Sporosarcina sp. FSL K6-1522 TaxID=2921554 RepID=UPI00315AC192